jgi:holo-[acyl-carrier protein] synthase
MQVLAPVPSPCTTLPEGECMQVLIGIGIDLVERSRVARSLERWGDRLVGKLMRGPEAARLPVAPDSRVDAIAAAIALKEAASKALGTGWSHGVFWGDVVADPGPPAAVRLEAGAARVATHLGSWSALARVETRGDLVIAEVWLQR